MVKDAIKQSNEEKLAFFLKNNIKAHVVKTNRQFLNGYIVKKISDGVYKIREDGYKKDVYLFLNDIYDVVQWVPKKKVLEAEK